MDFVRKFSKGSKEKKEKFKKMQEDYRLQKMLLEREKSSDQREVERYAKEQKEKEYKEMLTKIRKKQSDETWRGNSILKSDYNILKEDTKILDNGNSILSQKSIFLDKKNSILKQKNIFLDHKASIPMTNKSGMFFK